MLLQVEQMHKMTSILLKMVKVVILSENSCHFVSCSACNNNYFLLHYGFTILAECLTSIRLLICTPISENQGLIQTLEKCQIWCKP